jgi:uncharacterized protein with NAD-binding domain and iron-sulfur cluster
MAASFLDCTQPVTRYQDILPRVDGIVETAHQLESRIGYFAALYHHIIRKFKLCADQQIFAEPELIERLHVNFFNRYLAALRQYALGEKPSRPWQVAFDATGSAAPTVLQHLLLGMNAHISFDLALALVQSCTFDQLGRIQGDYLLMNEVLGGLICDIEQDIGKVWPALGLMNRAITGISVLEDGIMSAVIREGRAEAWSLASRLVLMSPADQQARLGQFAARIGLRGTLIPSPLPPLNLVAGIVRAGEHESIRRTIDILINRRRVPESAVLHLSERARPRKRVVILGGGVGALTTAFALTYPYNGRAVEYYITIYQLGWRLGGKGASGRNPDFDYRIEEHGLHLWFGCYDNAFRVIRKCYADLHRPPDAPLATWQDAFKPHSVLGIGEKFQGHWGNWIGVHYNNDLLPGDDTPVVPPWEFVTMGVKLMHGLVVNSSLTRLSATGNDSLPIPDELHGLLDWLGGNVAADGFNLGVRLLHLAHLGAELPNQGANTLMPFLQQRSGGLLKWLGVALDRAVDIQTQTLHEIGHRLTLAALDLFMKWLWGSVKDTIETDLEHRRVWIFVNFAYGNLRGALKEDIFARGVDHLNEYDYREWLGQHVFDDGQITINSSMMLAIYDAMFAYVDGDNRTAPGELFPPNAKMEAGTALRCGVRQFLLYKGSAVWKMQAGMGDTVFAPLYEVLKRRGVEFKFFHRVCQVLPSHDHHAIERIVISPQVKITREQIDKGGYDPLIDVKGLPCWPSAPRYEQIVDGARLHADGVDLESYATADQDVGPEFTLTAGQDFDMVVLGISLGALPYVCPELIAGNPKWKRMVDNVKTIQTQGFQLWLKQTAYELGWTLMGRPMSTGYETDPLDTWADMSHLIGHEGWGAAQYPEFLAYFCGAMLDTPPLRPSPSGPRVDVCELDQQAANDAAKANAKKLLHEYVTSILPKILDRDKVGQPHLRWDVLVDPRPDAPSGEGRFDAQFWRGNVQPSERYVLSVPKSSKHRLAAHDPHEYANLYLAGDWIDNGFNIGCVEAATMGGLLASNAISRYPKREQIFGLDLFTPIDKRATSEPVAKYQAPEQPDF